MNGLLDVLDGGLGNSIQDAGRFGYRHMGIAVSGFLDPCFAHCANALLGNPLTAACLEMRALGPTLKVRRGPVRVAVTGALTARIERQSGAVQTLDAWTTARLETGDSLRLGAVAFGTAYLAVSGGIDVPLELGSRSTYLRAGIGGIRGRLLQAGDTLPCTRPDEHDDRECRAAPWTHDEGPIHVVPGPQAGHFSREAMAALFAESYAVTPETDRMGMRLAGPVLAHRTPACADIVSDGVTPGAIQVPGNGLPIVLLADCQTVGGYPKIGTVIAADLPRLAQCRPGEALRFAAVDLDRAAALLLAREARWQAWCQGIGRFTPAGYLDETALYRDNLISGMVRAEP